MTQHDFLFAIVSLLETAGIPLMLTGSHASSFRGRGRATNDADLVIDPTAEQLDRFLALLGSGYHASADAARDALRRRSLFNVIDLDGGWKADLIIRKDRTYSLEEFRPRRPGTVHGRAIPIASPEGVILTKLERARLGASERQTEDALGVAVVQGANLDRDYLRKWAPALGVAEPLEELLRRAVASPPPAG